MNDKVELSCPKCNKDNTVNLSTQLSCKHCGEILTEKKYIKKPWLNLSMLFVSILGIGIGIVFSIIVYIKFAPSRYPIDIEYQEITNCISPRTEPLKQSGIPNKQKVCICAMNETMKIVDFDLYNENKAVFNSVFQQKANDICK